MINKKPETSGISLVLFFVFLSNCGLNLIIFKTDEMLKIYVKACFTKA